MDGLTATKIIRNMVGPMATIPIITLTAHSMVGDKEICLASGANAYLSKPIESQKMVSAITTWSQIGFQSVMSF